MNSNENRFRSYLRSCKSTALGSSLVVGAAVGIIVGSVVFTINRNSTWIWMGVVIGAALGDVVGRALKTNRP